jgi:hypothetical protein
MNWQFDITGQNALTANGRFCEMAAVTPQTILCEIERLSPAGMLVEAATSQSRWDVRCNVGTAYPEQRKNLIKMIDNYMPLERIKIKNCIFAHLIKN